MSNKFEDPDFEDDLPDDEDGFIEVGFGFGVRDPKDKGEDFVALLDQYKFDAEFFAKIFTMYRRHAGFDYGWTPDEHDQQEILTRIMIYKNIDREGGYIFDMPVEHEGGEMDVLSFVVPEDSLQPYRIH